MGDPRVEIEAVCEVHGGSGRLVVRREGDRVVLEGHADQCTEWAITVVNPAQRYLDHLAAAVELAAARSVLREIITLADQVSVLTDEQLRFRLLALTECAAPRSAAAPRSPIGRWLSDAPESAPGGRSGPAPAAPMSPAGHRLIRPCAVPGGQPEPDPADTAADADHGHGVAGGDPVPPVPRWARCPTDQHLHLLAPDEVAAAGVDGRGRAGCGRLIPAGGLTIEGASVGFCVGCLAVGVAR